MKQQTQFRQTVQNFKEAHPNMTQQKFRFNPEASLDYEPVRPTMVYGDTKRQP